MLKRNKKMEKSTQHGIKSSGMFMVLGTKDFFDDIPIQQVMLAKGLNKPFRVLLGEGVIVPDWFKEGVNDYKQKVVDLDNIENINIKEMKDFLRV